MTSTCLHFRLPPFLQFAGHFHSLYPNSALLSSVLTAAVTHALISSRITSTLRPHITAVDGRRSYLARLQCKIFQTIPEFAHVRSRTCYGRRRPHENATLGLNFFHITVAEFYQMRLAVWLPGIRHDCQSFVVGIKVVVQPLAASVHPYTSSCWSLSTYPL